MRRIWYDAEARATRGRHHGPGNILYIVAAWAARLQDSPVAGIPLASTKNRARYPDAACNGGTCQVVWQELRATNDIIGTRIE